MFKIVYKKRPKERREWSGILKEGRKMKKVNILALIGYLGLTGSILASLLMNFGSVSGNLDGWHGMSSGDAIWFAVVGLIVVAQALYILFAISQGNRPGKLSGIGVGLIVELLIIAIVPPMMRGNVDSDIQYLFLRVCEGFENGIYIDVITAILGLVGLKMTKGASNV